MNHAGWPDFIHWHTWNEKHFKGRPLKIPDCLYSPPPKVVHFTVLLNRNEIYISICVEQWVRLMLLFKIYKTKCSMYFTNKRMLAKCTFPENYLHQ